MYRTQDLTIRATHDLKVYKLPVDKIEILDIGKEIFLLENGEVCIEKMGRKISRTKEIYKMEKIDNKPIINLDTNLGDYDDK